MYSTVISTKYLRRTSNLLSSECKYLGINSNAFIQSKQVQSFEYESPVIVQFNVDLQTEQFSLPI